MKGNDVMRAIAGFTKGMMAGIAIGAAVAVAMKMNPVFAI